MKPLSRLAGTAPATFLAGCAIAVAAAIGLRELLASAPGALAFVIPTPSGPQISSEYGPLMAMLLGGLVLILGELLLVMWKPGILGRHGWLSIACGFAAAAVPAYALFVFHSEPGTWIRRQHSESASAIRRFLKGYPTTSHRDEAMDALRRAERAWLSSHPGDSMAGLVLSLAGDPSRRIVVRYAPEHRFESETAIHTTSTTAGDYRDSMRIFEKEVLRIVNAFVHSLASDAATAPPSASVDTVTLDIRYSARYHGSEYEWHGTSGAGRVTPIVIDLRWAIYGPGQTEAARTFDKSFYPDARPSWSGQMEMHNVLAQNVSEKAIAALKEDFAGLP